MTGIFLFILGIISLILYFLPTGIANDRDHPNHGMILLVNLFFGWTVLGWLICLFWALADKGPNAKSVKKGNKKCPQCAEWVKNEAKVCRFCNFTFLQDDNAIKFRFLGKEQSFTPPSDN